MPKATRKSCASPLKAGVGEVQEHIIGLRKALLPHPKSLPTNGHILRAIQEKRNKTSEQIPLTVVVDDTVSEITYIWVDQGGIFNVISKKRIRTRVLQLFNSWKNAVKALQGKRNF